MVPHDDSRPAARKPGIDLVHLAEAACVGVISSCIAVFAAMLYACDFESTPMVDPRVLLDAAPLLGPLVGCAYGFVTAKLRAAHSPGSRP